MAYRYRRRRSFRRGSAGRRRRTGFRSTRRGRRGRRRWPRKRIGYRM